MSFKEHIFNYASTLNQWVEGSPAEFISGEFKDKVLVFGSIHKNIKAAKEKVKYMNARIERLEKIADSVSENTDGQRLDKLR